MRLNEADKITLVECRKRALMYLSSQAYCVPASCVGNAIWPSSEMRAQGLGGAASRILRGLQKDGLANWSSNGRDAWGWEITRAGRKVLEERTE